MHTQRRAFHAVNGDLILMRIWSVNILRFCGIVAKRRVVNTMKDNLQINIKERPSYDQLCAYQCNNESAQIYLCSSLVDSTG